MSNKQMNLIEVKRVSLQYLDSLRMDNKLPERVISDAQVLLVLFYKHYGLTKRIRVERTLVKDLERFHKTVKPRYSRDILHAARTAIIVCYRGEDGNESNQTNSLSQG